MVNPGQMIDRRDAKKLAIAYAEYISALRHDEPMGTVMWGEILGQIQTYTGLVIADDIEKSIKMQRERIGMRPPVIALN